MIELALRQQEFWEGVSSLITSRADNREVKKSKPYSDKEAEEFIVALAKLRVDSRARLEHDLMLKKLMPLPHSLEETEEIPYYDEEFNMSQSIAHANTVNLVIELLNQVATMAGLRHLNDNAVWYIDKEGNSKQLYPDYALTANTDLNKITAKELLLTIEVVSTSRTEKEKKDTERMFGYNARSCHSVDITCTIFPGRQNIFSVYIT